MSVAVVVIGAAGVNVRMSLVGMSLVGISLVRMTVVVMILMVVAARVVLMRILRLVGRRHGPPGRGGAMAKVQ